MTSHATPSPLLQVIDGGFCVGCGACAGVGHGMSIGFDVAGRYVATPHAGGGADAVPNVCPFADGVPDEDQLGRELYAGHAAHDPHLGFFVATYAGWVTEDGFRERGSSGGLGSWILCELLRTGQVDRVVHVVAGSRIEQGGPLFEYAVSSTTDDVRSNAKSRYYPIEMSGVIRAMLDTPGRYAVVGIPCYLKAIRLACRENPLLRERVRFTVGLVCGHLKSKAFAEMLGWQCGIPPGGLTSIDFRHKIRGRAASDYGITVSGRTPHGQTTAERANTDLYGCNWGLGYFKYKACDFCDDVMAELADVTVGDAWLPEFERDSRGTNVVVVRALALDELLQAAALEGRVHLEPLAKDRAIASQAPGFRHRRDGLRYRLWAEDQAGRWRPRKREAPSTSHLSPRQQRLFRLRTALAERSHEAFVEAKKAGDFAMFISLMEPLKREYGALYAPPLWKRLISKMRRGAAKVGRALGIGTT